MSYPASCCWCWFCWRWFLGRSFTLAAWLVALELSCMCCDHCAAACEISYVGLLRSVLACVAVGCRWNFVQGESGLQANRLSARQAASSKLYRRKLQKRLMHHKQQLLDLQQAKKHFFTAQVWQYFVYLYCYLSKLGC